MSNYKRYFKASTNPVFITFVTFKRREILIPNIDILRNSLKYTKTKYVFKIIAISVLKEHCHMIIFAKDSIIISKIVITIKNNVSFNVLQHWIL